MNGYQIIRIGQAVTSYYKQAEAEPELNEGLEKYMQQNLTREDYNSWQGWSSNYSQPQATPPPPLCVLNSTHKTKYKGLKLSV
jgi:hypothetical protein